MKIKILVSLTDEQHTMARQQSISLFGYENVSGLIGYWITNYIPAGPPTLKTNVSDALEAPGSTITPEPMVTIQKASKAVESVNNVYDVRFMPNNHKDKMMQIGTWEDKKHTLFRTENIEVGDKITVIKHQKDNNIT